MLSPDYQPGNRRNSCREDYNCRADCLDVTDKFALNTDGLIETVTIFLDAKMLYGAGVDRRPRRKRENWQKEKGEPKSKFHPAIRLPLDRKRLYADAIMGEDLH